MKNNQTSLGKAIIKTVLMLCIVMLAVELNAQNLGDRSITQALADAASSKNFQDKAEKFKDAAARLWKLAEDGKPENKEERLKLALQYADSSKYYYMLEHNRLQTQLNKSKKDSLMRATYIRLAGENGKDTMNANWLTNGIKADLKKYDKPQTQATPPQQSATPKSETPILVKPAETIMKRDSNKDTPPKGDSEVKIEMIELHLRSSEPIKIDSIKPPLGWPQGYSSDPSGKSRTDWPEQIPYDGPREPKNTSGVTSKVIVTDVPETPEPKTSISWETGIDAGVTWSPMSGPTSEPSFIHMTDPTFGTDSQVQEMWNEIFRGMTFPNIDSIKTTNLPGWQLGVNAGCIINDRFEIKLAIAGGTFTAKAEMPVRVVRMVPPTSPSAPPTTQQSTEIVNEKVVIGNFNTRLTGRIYFGKKVRGYAEAGGVFGLNHSSAVMISVADYSEKKNNAKTTIYGGGTLGLGINIPLTDILHFETGVNTDLVSMRGQFSATLGLNAGIRILF